MPTSNCPHCEAALPEPVVFCGTCGRRVEGWEGEPQGDGSAPADGAALTRRAEVNSELRRAIAKSKEEGAPRADDPAATQPMPSATRVTAPSRDVVDDPAATLVKPPGPRVVKMMALTLALGLVAAGAAVWGYRKLHPPPPPPAPVVVNLDTPVEEAVDPAPAANPADPKARKSRRRKGNSPASSAAAVPGAAPAPAPAPGAAPAPAPVPGAAPAPAAPPKAAGKPAAPAVDPNNLANLGNDNEEAPPSEEELREEQQAAAYADGIRFVLRAHRAQVVACYERVFKSEGVSPGGRVVVDWTIHTDGKARKVHTTQNTSGQEGLGKCLEQRIAEWDFPKPPQDFTTSYPFVFSAGS
jgi:hypothetical protein